MSRRQKKLFYIGFALAIVVLFCGGILVGYVQRNSKLCPDGKPAVSQEDDPMLGHTDYLCHNGVVVTK
ncbi:MAG TPA: hypothetical protein VGL76_07290 [Gaiellaceae bacterium]